jgi:hypothetical protein
LGGGGSVDGSAVFNLVIFSLEEFSILFDFKHVVATSRTCKRMYYYVVMLATTKYGSRWWYGIV